MTGEPKIFFDTVVKSVSFDRPLSLCIDESKKQDSVFGIYILSTIHTFLKYTQASTNILSHQSWLMSVRKRTLRACVSVRLCHTTVTNNSFADLRFETTKVCLMLHDHWRQWGLGLSLSFGDRGHRRTFILSIAGWCARGLGVFHR